MLFFFEVLVLLSLVAVLFSWTMMLRISPRARARLSAAMLRELASCQSESAAAGWSQAARRRAPRAARLKGDEDGLFILHLSAEFAFGLGITDTHELAGGAVLEHFD